jgi:hypothetical protein
MQSIYDKKSACGTKIKKQTLLRILKKKPLKPDIETVSNSTQIQKSDSGIK